MPKKGRKTEASSHMENRLADAHLLLEDVHKLVHFYISSLTQN